MTEGKIGIALQGAGWVSTEHIRAYMLNPHVRIVAIGSRTKEGAQRKAREMGLEVSTFDDFDELLACPGVEAVSICTPPKRHSHEVVRAAEAGKHLLIEKPVATSFEELRVMCEAVRKAKVCTVVGFVLRWNPAVINIRTCLTEGLLGTPFYVGADYRHNLRQSGFDVVRGDVGAMLEGGCHAMDMARYLMGSDIVCVSALGWRSAPEPEQAGRSEPEQAGEASDIVSILQFENGAVGKVSAFTSQWMPYQFNIEVLGTEGAMRGNRLYTKRLPGLVDFAELPTVLPDSGDVAHHPFGPEIDHFVDCILAGSESGVSLEDVVNPHEACFAAEMSRANNGAAIRLPLAG